MPKYSEVQNGTSNQLKNSLRNQISPSQDSIVQKRDEKKSSRKKGNKNDTK